ncbi:MAG TPA: efflux RND transporter permease subunit [Clostridia bacterium]|nr:efflux RND transporter permease subunit [Clostridia bacterium]
MWLCKVAIRRPVTVIVLTVLILLLGLTSLRGIGIDLLPKMTFPVMAIITRYSGAGPSEVEQLVTRPLEEMIGTVTNVRSISSMSQEGVSMVFAEFEWGTNMDTAATEVRERIDLVKGYLPDDVSNPMVIKADPSMIPVIQLSLSGGRDLAQLTSLAEDLVKPRLERIDGVSAVGITGGVTEEVHVILDPVRLAGYGISPSQVAGALAMENVNLPGGAVEQAGTHLVLRTMGEFQSLEDVERVVIPTGIGMGMGVSPSAGAVAGATMGGGLDGLSGTGMGAAGGGGGSVTSGFGGSLGLSAGANRPPVQVMIRDVGRVEYGYAERRQITRVNGRPSIGLVIQKQSGANTVQVSDRVLEEVKKLQKELPSTVSLQVALDQAEFIRLSIMNLLQNIVIGGILAVLVLWVFLRSVKSTLVIAVSIPVSAVAALVLVYFSGMTLNLISLGGLALGVGMLVDNSIVVLESIFRHRQKGKEAEEAAYVGTTEVGGAVTASTLTTIAVFVPILFISGLAAQIFRELALTVSFALATSLFVAVTFVPMVAARMMAGGLTLSDGVGENEASSGPSRRKAKRWRVWVDRLGDAVDSLPVWYRGVLGKALRRRKPILILAVVAMVACGAAIPVLGSELIPMTDSGIITLNVTMPKGSALSETARVAGVVEEECLEIPEIDTVFETVGSESIMMFGLSEGQSDLASFTLELVPKDSRERSTEEVAEELRRRLARIPGADLKVSTGSAMGFNEALMGAPLQVSVKGDDLERVKEIAAAVAARIKDVPGLRDVKSTLEEGRPELRVIVDRGRAAFYGFNAASIASTLKASVQGETAAKFRVSGDEMDIRVVLEEGARATPQDVEAIQLTSPLGVTVPLKEVASLVIEEGPTTIEREDQARVAYVNAELTGRTLGQVVKDVEARLKDLPLPYGYSVSVSGQAEQMAEAFGDLSFALVLAIVLVYMVMAAQFESFIQPAIIMGAVPLALTGVIPGLILTRTPVSIPVYIGAITLAGIVVNNAIVLVDYTNQLRARGMNRDEALVEAGATRLRPILMTTVTTVLGLLPLVLGIGEGSEMQRPLAVTVVGGLTMSTLLTLVVVPAIYTLVDDIGSRIAKRLGGRSRKVVAGVTPGDWRRG